MGRAVTIEQIRAATEEARELEQVRLVMLRHGLTGYEVSDRLHELTSTPVRVRCYICRLRYLVLPSIVYDGAEPICERCEAAACGRFACYAPATVAVDYQESTLVLCEGHGLMVLRDAAGMHGLRIRHLPDASSRRQKVDLRFQHRQHRAA